MTGSGLITDEHPSLRVMNWPMATELESSEAQPAAQNCLMVKPGPFPGLPALTQKLIC